jgi:hypothetical protein
MKLNLLERIIGVNVLGEYKEGNFITFKMIKSLKSKLLVNEKEIEEFNLKLEDGRYTWNLKGNEEVEIEITAGEKVLIKDLLVKLDGENKLNENSVSLYEKFVEN